ncbi:uncharacterized protein LOC113511658 [Galleria mellonella]|uniref:Uncharacterized protein LOC113511658 n=1 Tax=Galleria mellonella TaxID=7137 RepID=A0A6J1WCC0_GALME|nr:uncharacterized protein LOC113511658 [Galleria mellonella]
MCSEKKKMKLTESTSVANTCKRQGESVEPSFKRVKTEKPPKDDLQAKKRKNFITACERVSYEAYFDQCSRFQLFYLPTCAKGNCLHQEYKHGGNIKEIPSYAEESFKIEMKTNMWCEALEVCQLCITPEQYLSANVLKDIVEIMLNAHDDNYVGYTIQYLIDKCQTILSQNFSIHPPCMVKSLRKCYNDFLMSPMEPKEKTFTNRSQFECEKGIVKYCMNRLQYEISIESKDGPLINKDENIPEEMRQSVKGLHWIKEKLEIYELLERNERIERLMSVLECIIELLQYDLAIWHSRYTNNLGSHIMRSHKPLMAYILWGNNVLYTGTVNNNCRQILKLFVYMVHLQYPQDYIIIMTTWLNIIIQTFYICEKNSNCDYPNTGKYCNIFANEFYKIISVMPPQSIIRILERIQPHYMQYLVGSLHVQKLLSSQFDDIIVNLTNFIEKSQWNQYPMSENEINISKKYDTKPKRVKNILHFLSKMCRSWRSSSKSSSLNYRVYPKFDQDSLNDDYKININYVVHTMYITLEAYFDAFNVERIQETLDSLNEQILTHNDTVDQVTNYSSYSVTEHFIKKYRSIFQKLQELVLILHNLKTTGELPEVLKVFEKIGLLGL